jgi:hypothetical protein
MAMLFTTSVAATGAAAGAGVSTCVVASGAGASLLLQEFNPKVNNANVAKAKIVFFISFIIFSIYVINSVPKLIICCIKLEFLFLASILHRSK